MLLKFFCSIITLIPINWSFLHSGWFMKGLCGNVKFLGDGRRYSGPGWSSVTTGCTSIGLTSLAKLSLHLSCLCESSLILDLQD